MCQGTFFSIIVLFAAAVLIESRITCIEVLGVKVFLYHPECFAKTLEVYDLPGTQETNKGGGMPAALFFLFNCGKAIDILQ